MKSPIQILIDDFEFVLVEGNAPGRSPRHAELVKEARGQLARLSLLEGMVRGLVKEIEAKRVDPAEEVDFGEGEWEVELSDVFYTYEGKVRSSDWLFFIEWRQLAAAVDGLKKVLGTK